MTGLHLIFRIRRLRLTQTPPVLLAVLFVFHLCLARRIKKALLVSLLHGGQETRGLVEANRMQMLVVWEKGMWREEEQADEGMGG